VASRLLKERQHRSFPDLAGRQTSHPQDGRRRWPPGTPISTKRFADGIVRSGGWQEFTPSSGYGDGSLVELDASDFDSGLRVADSRLAAVDRP